MNKQELIDKAVEKFKGVWPKFNWDEEADYKHAIVQTIKEWEDKDESITYRVGDIQAGGTGFHKDYARLVCLKHEFTKRASELGWVNGYQWGVEYPMSGKPKLPNDIFVEVKDSGGEWWCEDNVGSFDWDSKTAISFFRITDQRYKPVDVEQVQVDWYDYNKQQAIALPPAGVECEVLNKSFGDATWLKCTIHWIGEFVIVYTDESCSERCAAKSIVKFRPLDYNRKADEERRLLLRE